MLTPSPLGPLHVSAGEFTKGGRDALKTMIVHLGRSHALCGVLAAHQRPTRKTGGGVAGVGFWAGSSFCRYFGFGNSPESLIKRAGGFGNIDKMAHLSRIKHAHSVGLLADLERGAVSCLSLGTQLKFGS
jgi:hypothetical protein